MAWLSSIASFTLSGIAEKVVESVADRALSLVESEVTRYRSVEEELDRLKRTSHRINSLLIDAEQRRYIEDDSVKLWLSQLKSVSFDTDGLLDAYQTALGVYHLQAALHAHPDYSPQPRKRKWYQLDQLIPSISPEWGPVQRRRFAEEIARINNRLDKINKDRKELRLKAGNGQRKAPHYQGTPPHLQTTPLHDQSTVIGRQHERDEIVDLLTSDLSMSSLPVVPIKGAAGIGKTTLARLVYDDPRIDQYFQFKAWVCLTDHGTDVRNATKEIYEKFTRQRCDLQAYEPLQNNLRNFLQSHQDDKFLLVIDNFFQDNFTFWEHLRAPLPTGKERIKFKILITTQNEQACRIMQALSRPSLGGLGDNECWQLLESLALPQVMNSVDRERLATLGNEIAKSCYGSPLAAKTLGTLLNGATEEEWSDVLSEMRALKDDKNGVLVATLKISYHHLPYHLKQCFAYCAIFPNGYKFERDQLIRYWMAEGLIQPVSRRRPEAVGIKYFDELLWRSFIEKIPNCDNSRAQRYKMPSLMYDLARLVSAYEFQDLESDDGTSRQPKSDHPEQVRYASLLHRHGKQPVKLESAELHPNLRTLKVCDELGDRKVPLIAIKARCFRKYANLRVLDLSNSTLICVPDTIAELIHLRYLGLSNTDIITLPEKICELFNLQTLDLKGCAKLAGLPQGIRKLINLRHLDLHLDWDEITDSTDMVTSPGVGELEQIQTLSRFSVSCNAKTQDCNIVELKDMNLKGELCVLNIERVPVKKPEIARNANLEGKQYIENLMLRWNASAHSDQVQWQLSKRVMQHLRPSNRLRKLWLINYPGTSFPDWIGDASYLSLETIRISNCNNFSFLLLLGQLPQLKNLQIDNIPAKSMDAFVGFPSLENLVLSNLPFLEKLRLENDIPKLKKVTVTDCPYLKDLVIHQKMQSKLERINCPNSSLTRHIPQD